MYLLSRSFLYNAFLLFIFSFIIRLSIFYGFMQFEQRYRQADSMDYHICALSIKHLHGMINPSTKEPIFWRTPGYPYFLSLYYDKKTAQYPQFEQCTQVHKQAIFWQIIICSCIPLLIFLFTYILTHSFMISWAISFVFVFHIGYCLASTYLLTDALASMLFLLFLLFFYLSFKQQARGSIFFNILCAALSLALYTWMRPNGIFIAIALSPLFLIPTPPHAASNSWKKKFFHACLFLSIFFALLAPWYIRNEKLTGHYFFCPMMGPYLQAFSAPRIMRSVLSKPLDYCIKVLCVKTHQEYQDQQAVAKALKLTKTTPRELICLRTALPWVLAHPFYFIYEWSKEVLKTTFDLYSYQLVALHEKTHIYDPLEEFLSDKLYSCLYKPTTPLWIKCIAWIELLFYALIWLGFFASIYQFLIYPIMKHRSFNAFLFMHLYIMGVIIGMTGGFGYARLRLCAEPLIIIASLLFWYSLYRKYKIKEKSSWIDYMHLGELNMPSN